MRDFLRDLKTQLAELLAQQALTTRLIAAGILVVVVALLAFQLAHFGRTVNLELLYAGLDAETAQAVREELILRGVDPKIEETDQGYMVRVPEGQALDLRLDLAATVEAASGERGWDLFNEKDFGTTYFALQIKKQRAIRGELARTIEQMEMVRDASVELSLPEQSVFLEEERSPKASVMITLQPDSIISKDQVASIQAFVAGSIDGLGSENVTVVDTLGNELSKPEEIDIVEQGLDNTERIIRIRQKQQREYEKYLEEKILTDVSQVFGRGHVTASVNVDFDYTSKRQTQVEYDKKKSVPLAEATTMKGENVLPRMAEGVTGVSAHIPPDGLAAGGAGGANGESLYTTEQIINHAVGRTETETVFPEYIIRRISASVVVDNLPATGVDEEGNRVMTRNKLDRNGQVTNEPNSLSEEQIRQLEDQVKGIINFSSDRPGGVSDLVAVVNMPFTSTAPISTEEVEREIRQFQWRRQLVQIATWIVLLVLVYFVIVRPLVRIVMPAGGGFSLEDMRAELPGEDQVLLEGETRGMLGGAGDTGALPQPTDSPDMIEARQNELDDEILELARSNPKKVPIVLKAWMERS